MKITFLIDNMKFSGGRKFFFEYAKQMQKRNHNVKVLTLSHTGELLNFINADKVDSFSINTIPKSDIIIATTPREVEAAVKSNKGKVIHFCQGFEIEDLENRIFRNVLPLRYQKYLKKGLLGKLKLFYKKQYWKKKIAYFDKVYNLNTTLVTVSQHLKELLEKRYSKNIPLCKYGINNNNFYPDNNWKFRQFTHEKPCRIINVGPMNVTFKGIPDTLAAIKKIKKDNYPIQFIRVEPQKTNFTNSEKEVTDEFYEALPPNELGKLLRSCDVFISNSHEGEGFGLHSIEALACGCVSILNSISSYKNFSNKKNYCLFVKEGKPIETYEAVKKILILNEHKFTEIRNNAISVAEEYDFQKACDRFEDILISTLKNEYDDNNRSIN